MFVQIFYPYGDLKFNLFFDPLKSNFNGKQCGAARFDRSAQSPRRGRLCISMKDIPCSKDLLPGRAFEYCVS